MGTPRVHLGANWVPLGPKYGSKPQKITMPQNSNFRLPNCHRFFPKSGCYGYGSKSRWRPPRVHLGASGVPLGKKMGPNRNLPCPKMRIFDYPAVIDFSQKMDVTVMAPNHGGDTLGSILVQWDPIGSKKWVKTVKNYHAWKFEFSITPRSSIFHKKWKLRLWRQITVNGVQLGKKKWVKTIKNYYAQKFEFSITPRSSVFRKKWKLRLWRQITVGTPYGPSWGQWGPIGSKNGSKPQKITMPENSNFRLPHCHRFFPKNGCYVTAPNHGGDTIESLLGPMGSHWVQKMGQNRKKLPCPKIRIFDYPAVIGFSQKMEVTVMAPNHGGDPLGFTLWPMGSHWV